MNNKASLALIIALLSGILFTVVGNAQVRRFQAPMGEAKWRVSESRLRCGLKLTVLDYGSAYFEHYSARVPNFVMTHWGGGDAGASMQIMAIPPVWKPRGRRHFIAHATMRGDQYALILEGIAARKLLASLAQGYRASFQYRSAIGEKVVVELSPIHFQQAFHRYRRCVGRLLPFTFADVEETILYYESDSFRLSAKDKRKLDRVRRYVMADPSIKRVDIAAYTDDTGRRSYNNAISELRAKAVYQYLLTKGVPKRKINYTWYGKKFPQAPNLDAAGRAENRRTVIILHK